MKPFISIVLTLLLTTAAGHAKEVSKEIDVKSGGKLQMDLKSGGDIDISSWDKNEVTVDATLEGRDGDKNDLSIEPESDGVSIKTDYVDEHRKWESHIEFHIKVPKKFDLDLHSAGGEFHIDGVEGSLEGTTMGGEVRLSGLTGSIRFKTMGGNISVSKSHCDGNVTTMGRNRYP